MTRRCLLQPRSMYVLQMLLPETRSRTRNKVPNQAVLHFSEALVPQPWPTQLRKTSYNRLWYRFLRQGLQALQTWQCICICRARYSKLVTFMSSSLTKHAGPVLPGRVSKHFKRPSTLAFTPSDVVFSSIVSSLCHFRPSFHTYAASCRAAVKWAYLPPLPLGPLKAKQRLLVAPLTLPTSKSDGAEGRGPLDVPLPVPKADLNVTP